MRCIYVFLEQYEKNVFVNKRRNKQIYLDGHNSHL